MEQIKTYSKKEAEERIREYDVHERYEVNPTYMWCANVSHHNGDYYGEVLIFCPWKLKYETN